VAVKRRRDVLGHELAHARRCSAYHPALAKGRQVIAVDLQGHGRTADIDRPLSVELMADDIAALIKYLKLDSVPRRTGADQSVRSDGWH